MDTQNVVKRFADICCDTQTGIASWLHGDRADPKVLDRLARVQAEPLSKVQFNQLLVLSREASVSDGFFSYYWVYAPPTHTYDVTKIDGFDNSWLDGASTIKSLDHLHWGLYRFTLDSLLYFGSIPACFKALRSLDLAGLIEFFESKRFDTASIAGRGPALPLKNIGHESRYLISEMAFGAFEGGDGQDEPLLTFLRLQWNAHKDRGGGAIEIKRLIAGEAPEGFSQQHQYQFTFSADEILDQEVTSLDEIEALVDHLLQSYRQARDAALENTQLYLSVVNDLDVYVATSMRSRKDFIRMATACDEVFGDTRLTDLHLRYFDPTMSAADGHEDKGLVECLMVKCAKVLVYCAGDKESYGKDAEAAMALSLGKPVIFFCDEGKRQSFYKEVHPLSRLIEFSSGVAVGAMVTDSAEEVSELLRRIFNNDMEYEIRQHDSRPGFLRVVDRLTSSVIRLQTNNEMLTKTFWNNYHNRATVQIRSLAAGKELEHRLE